MHDYAQSIQRRLTFLDLETVPRLDRAQDEVSLDGARETLREELGLIEADLAELEMQAEDFVLDGEREGAHAIVRQFRHKVDELRARIRSSSLAAKQRIHKTRSSLHRQALFGAGKKNSAISASSSPASGDDELMNATSDVTSSLRRTMQLMQQELDRSLLSNQLLEQSTGTMTLATEQHVTFTALLSASKTLITSMERADVVDRILIMGALIFFGLVCLYILKRRIVDRGLRAASVVASLVPRGKAIVDTTTATSSTSLPPSADGGPVSLETGINTPDAEWVEPNSLLSRTTRTIPPMEEREL